MQRFQSQQLCCVEWILWKWGLFLIEWNCSLLLGSNNPVFFQGHNLQGLQYLWQHIGLVRSSHMDQSHYHHPRLGIPPIYLRSHIPLMSWEMTILIPMLALILSQIYTKQHWWTHHWKMGTTNTTLLASYTKFSNTLWHQWTISNHFWSQGKWRYYNK